jgi:hypothetical protein
MTSKGGDPNNRGHQAPSETMDDQRTATYREYDERISKAWQSDSDFSNALYMAYVAGELLLLRDYIAAGKPVPQEHTFVAGKIAPMDVLVAKLLGRQPQQQRKLGRPPRVARQASAAEQAERNAAWLVAFMLKGWRVRTHRKRVPGIEVKKMISAAITEAAKAFGVPLNAINESNVRNLLKSGRVVVRSRTPT